MIRIVKMTFQPDKVQEFLTLFGEIKSTIQSFEGCESVELLRDKHQSNIFFTYSVWTEDRHLQVYRHSAFFDNTWQRTKALFADKPAAWSVDKWR